MAYSQSNGLLFDMGFLCATGLRLLFHVILSLARKTSDLAQAQGPETTGAQDGFFT